ncbi:MAG: Fis family transcriptional regulator [Acidobacteria bacterium]|nr:MAG: Fis family transcriptional regulator [Acidobacteriota bacterium]
MDAREIQYGLTPDNSSEEQKQSEARLRTIIDTIPVIAWCTLPDGSGEFWNRRWHDYTGLPLEAARGWGWRAAIHPEDLDRIEKKWRVDLASGQAGEVQGRLRRFDGEYRWFLFRYEPFRDEAGEIVRWYGTNTDIEDLKRAEQKLRESEEEFHRITDAIPQAITVLSPDGTVLYANRVALEQTGLTLDEVKARSFFLAAFHPEDIETLRAKREAGLASGEPFELDLRGIRKHDGEYQWRLVQYNPMRNEHGRVIRWYVTGTDIQRQKTEEEMLRNENVALREEIESSMLEEIVGSSEPMRQVLKQVAKVAPSDSTVLILGETGTGKELIARALHRRSGRTTKPFVRVNCAAIPQSLIASELFGHEKGAFTGALQRRVGRFESADGGTLFLDEVGDLPAETQIALLRVLQEREIERVGSNHPISVDVRLIAATNRDLSAAVASGAFREDLFYRLNVFPIALPALRERAVDIPLLLQYFVGRYAKKAGKTIKHIDGKTLGLFKAYHWPGNIRELQNVVERAVILSEGDTFSVDERWLRTPVESLNVRDGLPALAQREVEMIKAALAESHGRVAGPSGAAAKLKIPRQTLESKIRRLGINKYGNKVHSAK